MSPMGFAVHRQVYADDIDFDYEYYTAATDEQERQPTKPVPIWLCVFLVVSYILGGAFLFSTWEDWSFLDSAYFCFITLTTIGSCTLYSSFIPFKRIFPLQKEMYKYCIHYIITVSSRPIKFSVIFADFRRLKFFFEIM